MTNSLSFQRLAAIAAIVSCPIALASYVPVLAAAGFNLSVFGDFGLLLATGAPDKYLWHDLGAFSIPAGESVIRLRSDGPFPAIDRIALIPVP